jgi:hypothetical protein
LGDWHIKFSTDAIVFGKSERPDSRPIGELRTAMRGHAATRLALAPVAEMAPGHAGCRREIRAISQLPVIVRIRNGEE